MGSRLRRWAPASAAQSRLRLLAQRKTSSWPAAHTTRPCCLFGWLAAATELPSPRCHRRGGFSCQKPFCSSTVLSAAASAVLLRAACAIRPNLSLHHACDTTSQRRQRPAVPMRNDDSATACATTSARPPALAPSRPHAVTLRSATRRSGWRSEPRPAADTEEARKVSRWWALLPLNSQDTSFSPSTPPQVAPCGSGPRRRRGRCPCPPAG